MKPRRKLWMRYPQREQVALAIGLVERSIGVGVLFVEGRRLDGVAVRGRLDDLAFERVANLTFIVAIAPPNERVRTVQICRKQYTHAATHTCDVVVRRTAISRTGGIHVNFRVPHVLAARDGRITLPEIGSVSRVIGILVAPDDVERVGRDSVLTMLLRMLVWYSD